jgi:hypothetical protein
MEERATAYAKEQGRSSGLKDFAGSRGKGPEQFGGINFSSPAAFIGSLVGAFIAAFIITTVQAMFGKDFSSSGRGIKHRTANGSSSRIYIPDVIIT